MYFVVIYIIREVYVMDKEFRISTVIPIYNAENYLRETIECVLKQSIGFERNIELILVNDGSTDSSEKICKEYEKEFPNNVKYFKKPNGGSSDAKNFGIKYATGKYINFLDSDDILSNNALENCCNFLERNEKEIDMVAMPVIYFEKKNGLHSRYNKFNNQTNIVDLLQDTQAYVFSTVAAVYKREVFKRFKFNTNLKVAEDLYLNTKLFIDNPKFGIMSSNDASYYYRKRYANDSITNANEYEESWLIYVLEYITKGIKDYCKKKGETPEFVKNIFIYNLVKRFKTPNFVNRDSVDEFYSIARNILKDIDDNIIVNYQYDDYYLLAMMFMIKYNNYNIQELITVDNKNNVLIKDRLIENLENYSIQISSLRVVDNMLNIQGYFNDITPKEFNIYYKHKNMLYNTEIEETDNIFLQKRCFDKVVSHTYAVKVQIPFEEGTYKFILRVGCQEVLLQLMNIYGDEGILINKDYFSNEKKYELKMNNKKILIREKNKKI